MKKTQTLKKVQLAQLSRSWKKGNLEKKKKKRKKLKVEKKRKRKMRKEKKITFQKSTESLIELSFR